MPRQQKSKTEQLFPETNRTSALSSIPAAAALSFLKDTRGLTTWTARDMARTLSITEAETKQVIAVLELQGYVKPSGTNEWMTTMSGEEVSGSKQPRYRSETIGQALSWLGKRIAEVNRDSGAHYKVVEAVAYGDFLNERPLVQAADVGIQLVQRKAGEVGPDSAIERKAQSEFLRQLQGKTSLIHVRQFENWMSTRKHRRLL